MAQIKSRELLEHPNVKTRAISSQAKATSVAGEGSETITYTQVSGSAGPGSDAGDDIVRSFWKQEAVCVSTL